MQDIFLGKGPLIKTIPNPPYKRQAIDQLRFVTDKVIGYQQSLWKGVGGDHPLIGLILSFAYPLASNDDDFLWNASVNAFRISNAFHMTSLWGAGKVFHPGIFYGPDAHEVIMITTDDFDPKAARAHWRRLEPIQVVSHAINDFTLPMLDGSGHAVTQPGLVVIRLNYPMLLFQYKLWWETFVRDAPTDSKPGINLFIQDYPLANMLLSHMDVTMVNRFEAEVLKAPLVTQKDDNPFYLNFSPERVSKYFQGLAPSFESRRLSFDDWVTLLPTLTGRDYHHYFTFPDLPFVTQVEWALFLARLPTLSFLLQYNKAIGSEANKSYINQIKHWLLRMRNGRLFGHGLRGGELRRTLDRIDLVLAPYL